MTEPLDMLDPQFDVRRSLVLEGEFTNLTIGGFLALNQGLHG
jgi:hypothetical protein